MKHPEGWLWTPSQLYGEDDGALSVELKKEDCTVIFLKSTPTDRDTGKNVAFEDLVAGEKEGVIRLPTDYPEMIRSIEGLVEEEITIDKTRAVKLSYLSFYEKSNNILEQLTTYRIFIPLEMNKTFQIAC